MRLTNLDIPDRLGRVLPVWASQVLFALVCCAATVVLRALADIWLPDAGPFALTVPVVLVATLFGRWLCGAITQVISSLYAWYYVLPVFGSFTFVRPEDGPRVAANVLAGFFVVALAELFRRAMRDALASREALLIELQHRVKNNFASIASVLRMQMSEADSEDTKAAFRQALGRVESFAQAYGYLYHGTTFSDSVDMGAYLKGLCASLKLSLAVDLNCDIDKIQMPRDRAIAVGLLVNELITNSAKHAFEPGKPGSVSVVFKPESAGYHLAVTDNGRGISSETRRAGSFGLRLIENIAQQARGVMHVDTGPAGTQFSFVFEK